ncbi:divalent cation transporter [Algiphilus sp.]|uniref:ZIP family metal transporter n=1 Tax=Algiphilus sp. TaxID=1872431 RepID=UPI002A5E70E9|nr:divalent cation transporter [Pseudomonadota bacterium]
MLQGLAIILFSAGAGACILLGAALARMERLRPHWLEREFRHFVIAFGGGILLGAVAVVLVPEGRAQMDDSVWAVPLVLAGGGVFFVVERALGLRRRESPQLMGMILDYVPEAIALGGMVATGSPSAALLAVLIGLQNLPEGFNSYRELASHGGRSPKTILRTMAWLVPLGPLAGLLGFFFLAEQPALMGAIMLFASGGILYLLFQELAPQSRLDKHWAPPLGAVFGFCLALLGDLLLAHA